MKYTEKNKPMQCMFTQSDWYNEMKTYQSKVVGVLWHDTGAGNPNLKRYVQPSKNDKNYFTLINKLGTNGNGNDWNRSTAGIGVNAFIGKLADGTVTTVQVSPESIAPWGCGNGSKGSCNGYIVSGGVIKWQGQHWLQFEICDDYYESKDYFNKVYKEAVEFTAYICKKYNINPNGTVKFNGVKVPTILCHNDAYNLGLGSGHADVTIWFNKFGKTMKDVRTDVAKLIKESEVEVFKKGETGLGIKGVKSALNVGKLLGIYTSGMEKNGGYGAGVAVNVKQAQKRAGLTEKDEIDDATVTAIWSQTETAIKAKLIELNRVENALLAKQKEVTALQKKVDEATAKIDKLTDNAGDLDGDGKITTKDLLALRKKLNK